MDAHHYSDATPTDDGSLRGGLGLIAVLVAGLLAVSYPTLTLGVVLGALAAALLRRARRAIETYHRSTASDASAVPTPSAR